MITKVDVHQALINAKETFDQRGGAQYRLLDQWDRVCAIGALRVAILGHANQEIKLEDRELYSECACVLNNSALELHGRTIANVNDSVGYMAAQAVYDHAIKLINSEDDD
jgi:hypothetical protein